MIQCHQWDLEFPADQLDPECLADQLVLVDQCRLSDQSVQCRLSALRDLLAQLVPVFLAVPAVLWDLLRLAAQYHLSVQYRLLVQSSLLGLLDLEYLLAP